MLSPLLCRLFHLQVANAAEEAKDPANDLPWGIVGSLGVATLLYVLMSLCIVSGWGCRAWCKASLHKASAWHRNAMAAGS